MTSIEYVIWMRGFMAGATGSSTLGEARVSMLREKLAEVNGVPQPREKRTVLIAPDPEIVLALPSSADQGE